MARRQRTGSAVIAMAVLFAASPPAASLFTGGSILIEAGWTMQ